MSGDVRICKDCGGEYAKWQSYEHPGAAVPLALGGAPFDRSNVRLAHRSCNSKAGNRAKQAAAAERAAFARIALWLGDRLAAA